MTSRCGLAGLALCLGIAGTPAPAQNDDAASGEAVYPKWTMPRFLEDWSDFDPAAGSDFFDPIKRVDLNEDGSHWATFGGELRLRAEGWQNFAWNSANEDAFVLGRMLGHGDFRFGDNIRVFAEARTSLSTDRDLPGGKRAIDVDTLAVQNLFADVSHELDGGIRLTGRVGRQQYKFGKQRLVSPLPWANAQRSWDGATLIVNYEGWRIDGFYSRYVPVQKYELNDWGPGWDFFGAYASGTVGTGEQEFDLDVYWLGISRKGASFNGDSGTEDRQSIGARFGGAIGSSAFSFDVEATYQFGDVGAADISAYAFASKLSYAIDAEKGAVAYAGFDYASGDSTPSNGNVGTFNQLFPLGHAYFGYMDYVGRQNIVDLSIGAKTRLTSRVTVQGDLHLFWLADSSDSLYNAGGAVVRATAPGASSEVGQELDFTLTYQVDRHMTLTAGYSHFFAGEFMSDTGTSKDSDWMYFMAQYNF